MDIETYNRREEMLKLHEELLSVEEAKLNGDNGYSVDEVIAAMNTVIEEIAKVRYCFCRLCNRFSLGLSLYI